jgi:hypothetical protein
MTQLRGGATKGHELVQSLRVQRLERVLLAAFLPRRCLPKPTIQCAGGEADG